MLKIDLNEQFIVYAIYNGCGKWYISDKEVWYLDYQKRIEAYKKIGYEIKEEYIDERGLYYDFDEITPGPMFKTNEEMVDYIKHIDERFDKQEIVNFKNRFMCCCDGYSSERILALIED